MGEDAFLTAKVYRSCFKVCFHDAEAFLDFPSAFIRFDYVAYAVVKICAHCVKAVIFFLFFYNGLVDVAYGFFGNLIIFCGVAGFDKTFGIILPFLADCFFSGFYKPCGSFYLPFPYMPLKVAVFY